MVIWLLGISGAGKTTLGLKLKQHFDSEGVQSFILDGDIVRNFFDNDLSYSIDERRQNIKRIMLAAHVLEQNGIIPIVCNIAPFEDLRQFARQKFSNYVQIYLKKSLSLAQANDVKNIYKDNISKSMIVGIDLEFDQPKTNELVVPVDSETVEESFIRIITMLNKRYFNED